MEQADPKGPNSPPTINSPGPKGKGSTKIIAAVILVIMVVAGFVVVYEKMYSPKVATPSFSSKSLAVVGQQYNFTVTTSQKFSDINLYFGDGTSASMNYSASGKYAFTHKYTKPGDAILFITEKMSNGNVVNFSNQLFPIVINPSASYVSNDASLGTIAYNLSASSAPTVANETIFSPGSNLNMSFGYYTEPVNSTFQVVGQTATISMAGNTQKTYNIGYSWNSSTSTYVTSPSPVDPAFSSAGLYIVDLKTVTAELTNTTTGTINSNVEYTTHAFLDVAVFKGAAVGTSTSTSTQTILVNNELEVGGYRSLDPAVAFDTVSLEPIYNTMLPLVGFNGSSTSSFVPMLAANLPSVQNGEINNNYANYSAKTPSGVSYNIQLQPYENYTFKIRSNATWQNGLPVTAWDVAYSFARIMLFDAGSPLTGGWMIAPYYLPGNAFKDNSFYNITNNMTVDNTTNSITLHFPHPMTQLELFGLLDFYRITSSKWLEQHGAGLTWTPSGFSAYKAQGSQTDYNKYVTNNIMSDGPYQLSYTVPGTEVVLIKNPSYNPPAAGMPPAKIDQIDLKYISSPTTTYLNLKSGAAQISTIPTNQWNEVNSLQKAGTAKAFTFPTPDIYFYKFNTQVDMKALSGSGGLSPGANLPSNIFTSENARKAFAYAYNYTYFLNYQVGNTIFNTKFAQLYAGYLETGVTFAQNYSVMKNVSQVPVYDLAMAKKYWNAFVNGTEKGGGIVWDQTAGAFTYNGKALNIPIFIQSADPVDTEGATTWAANLAKVIPGLTAPVVKLPFTQVIGESAVVGQNPMPVFWWSLAPAYAYPTDSVGGSEMPRIGGHLGGENITPAWFSSSNNSLANTTQANQLQQLLDWYANATSTPNVNVAGNYFHKINEQFVNMTLIVYTEQIYQYHIISTKLNPNVMVPYEENGLFGNDMLYNFMSYS